MGRWHRAWTTLHHYHFPIIGFVGLVVTVVIYGPGIHLISVGPLRFDAFYVAAIAFGSLLILSLTDEYDPEAYNLKSREPEE